MRWFLTLIFGIVFWQLFSPTASISDKKRIRVLRVHIFYDIEFERRFGSKTLEHDLSNYETCEAFFRAN